VRPGLGIEVAPDIRVELVFVDAGELVALVDQLHEQFLEQLEHREDLVGLSYLDVDGGLAHAAYANTPVRSRGGLRRRTVWLL